MRNVVIVTIKSWNIEEFQKLSSKFHDINFKLITKNEYLTYEELKKINPKYIFFVHWSWKIPKEIFESFECIIFHMTDLPFGRGGSPLQNLIVRGFKETKISAIKCVEEIDAGPIYCKSKLSLEGSATQIFKRDSKTIFNEMIPFIIENEIKPKKQEGGIVTFKRRKPEESNIPELDSIEKIYDYIRMLDAEGYPLAFMKVKNFKIEFSDASIKDGVVEAKAKIKLEG